MIARHRLTLSPSARRSIKATVYAPIKVRAPDAYEAFLSILELNGMTVVPAAPYYKIVESAKIETRPVPLSIDVRLERRSPPAASTTTP